MVHIASFWPRLAAALIDGAILFVIIQFIGKMFSLPNLATYVLTPFLGWLYYSLFLSSPWQATFGYKLNSLKVTSLHARRITFLHATLRFIYSLVSNLCILLNLSFFFTKRKQAFHDLLAKTVVLDYSNPKLYAIKSDKKLFAAGNNFILAKSIVGIWLTGLLVSSFFVIYFFYIMAQAYGVGLDRFIGNLPTSRSGTFNYSVVWETMLYDKDKDYSISTLAKCNDSSFVATGYFIDNKHDATSWIARFNEKGKELWFKELETLDSSFTDVVVATSRDAILIAIVPSPGSFRNNTAIMTKLDLSGKVLWKKTFKHQTINHIQKTQDGYIYVGSMFANNNETIVVKLDDDGKLLWQKQYGGDGQSVGNSIAATSDGGFIVLGSSTGKEITRHLGRKPSKNIYLSNHEVIKQNAWVFKIDENGSIQWEQVFDRNNYEEELVDLAISSEGELFLVGNFQYGYGNEDNAILLLKLTRNGEYIWSNIISGRYYDNANSITALDDSNYLLAANTTSLSDGVAKGWIIQVNEKGVILEDATTDSLNASPMGYLESMVMKKDGDILIGGKLKNNFFGSPKYGSIIYKLKRAERSQL